MGGAGWALAVVYSFPNFVEAVMGTLIVAGLGLVARHRFPERLGGLGERWVCLGATVVAGVYVITQELRIHDLGGANVTDPRDVAASVVGLAVAVALMLGLGMTRGES